MGTNSIRVHKCEHLLYPPPHLYRLITKNVAAGRGGGYLFRHEDSPTSISIVAHCNFEFYFTLIQIMQVLIQLQYYVSGTAHFHKVSLLTN